MKYLVIEMFGRNRINLKVEKTLGQAVVTANKRLLDYIDEYGLNNQTLTHDDDYELTNEDQANEPNLRARLDYLDIAVDINIAPLPED